MKLLLKIGLSLVITALIISTFGAKQMMHNPGVASLDKPGIVITAIGAPGGETDSDLLVSLAVMLVAGAIVFLDGRTPGLPTGGSNHQLSNSRALLLRGRNVYTPVSTRVQLNAVAWNAVRGNKWAGQKPNIWSAVSWN